MRVLEVPRSVLSKPVGFVALRPTAEALEVYIRAHPKKLRSYPQSCSMAVRLPSWDIASVTPIALVFSVARHDQLTYQAWINAATMHGLQVLNGLANDGRIHVHLVTDCVERTIRVPNVVKRHAAALLKRLSTRKQNWDEGQFAEARAQLETLYPTALRLWRACERERRG
jgi:hypothetical protein